MFNNKKSWRCSLRTWGLIFATNKDGKRLAVFEGYTYYASDRLRAEITCSMWRCTKGYPCKARFKATPDGEVIRVTTLQHTHPPPLIEIQNGIIRKISKKELYIRHNYYDTDITYE
ncbi:unnamed protein product [Euphydryas editha]|uniref:FLYWCH-type domain-containing protein n=1 Tax=Euphydryas editha TaxID=104508 RepID=A0AAU9TJK9_EUPED|nr:unnamed protein product [Euphydryas editha]